MSRILSLGSINVDRVENATAAELDALEAQYDWFPERGETVEVSAVPAAQAPSTASTSHRRRVR